MFWSPLKVPKTAKTKSENGNPKILILDEATASIDSYAEQLIQKATQKITHGRTSIVIAHRLSTVRNADSIIYMDSGEILGQAKYEKLREQLNAFDQQAKLMGL